MIAQWLELLLRDWVFLAVVTAFSKCAEGRVFFWLQILQSTFNLIFVFYPFILTGSSISDQCTVMLPIISKNNLEMKVETHILNVIPQEFVGCYKNLQNTTLKPKKELLEVNQNRILHRNLQDLSQGPIKSLTGYNFCQGNFCSHILYQVEDKAQQNLQFLQTFAWQIPEVISYICSLQDAHVLS